MSRHLHRRPQPPRLDPHPHRAVSQLRRRREGTCGTAPTAPAPSPACCSAAKGRRSGEWAHAAADLRRGRRGLRDRRQQGAVTRAIPPGTSTSTPTRMSQLMVGTEQFEATARTAEGRGARQAVQPDGQGTSRRIWTTRSARAGLVGRFRSWCWSGSSALANVRYLRQRRRQANRRLDVRRGLRRRGTRARRAPSSRISSTASGSADSSSRRARMGAK